MKGGPPTFEYPNEKSIYSIAWLGNLPTELGWSQTADSADFRCFLGPFGLRPLLGVAGSRGFLRSQGIARNSFRPFFFSGLTRRVMGVAKNGFVE